MILLHLGSGYGILVLPIVVFSFAFTYMGTLLWTMDSDYMPHHAWPWSLVFMLSAAGCWYVDRWLRLRSLRRAEPKTDPRLLRPSVYPSAEFERKALQSTKSPGSYLFIPMHWWAYIFGVLSLVIFVAGLTS
jgi:hypothetical protein